MRRERRSQQVSHRIQTRTDLRRGCCVLALVGLLLVAGVSLHAAEGFWTFENPPLKELKEACDFQPDATWFERLRQSAVTVAMPGSGGSGAFVSATGLVVTNRHVVLDYLSRFSKEDRNLVRDGFLADEPGKELRCEGLTVKVVVERRQLPAEVVERFQTIPDEGTRRRVLRQVEAQLKEQEEKSCQVVSFYGGAEIWVYTFEEYDDVRLVFAPEERLANFGGEPDNFNYPRHELDVALLRAYRHGAPARVAHWLSWSAKGAGDGEPVFCASHPGDNQRDLPVVQLWHLRDVGFPIEVTLSEEKEKALKKAIEANPAKAAKLQASLYHLQNSRKMSEGTAAILKREDVIKRLTEREEALRKAFAGSEQAQAMLGNAYEDAQKACLKLKERAAAGALDELRRLRVFGAGDALLSFASRSGKLNEAQRAAMAKSIQSFFREAIFAGEGVDATAEEAQLAGHLAAAAKLLSPEDALRKILVGDKTPAEEAHRIISSSKLISADGCCGLVEQGGEAVERSQDPVLVLLRALKAYQLDLGPAAKAAQEAEQVLGNVVQLIRRAGYAVRGKSIPPEATRSLRLSLGKVAGYELNGEKFEWRTTFNTQLARADAAKDESPFKASERLRAQKGKPWLDTPLNLVCTLDGGPGSSGAPVVNKQGELVGVLFDGNPLAVASVHVYVSPEMGGRSIAVHSAAVIAALQELYGAKTLVTELLDGKRP